MSINQMFPELARHRADAFDMLVKRGEIVAGDRHYHLIIEAFANEPWAPVELDSLVGLKVGNKVHDLITPGRMSDAVISICLWKSLPEFSSVALFAHAKNLVEVGHE